MNSTRLLIMDNFHILSKIVTGQGDMGNWAKLSCPLSSRVRGWGTSLCGNMDMSKLYALVLQKTNMSQLGFGYREKPEWTRKFLPPPHMQPSPFHLLNI